MKKMLLSIGLVIALTISAIPAFADFYQQSAVLSNRSTTSALSITTANVTSGRIIYAGAWRAGSITVSGGGNTGLKNYSGVMTLWGSNDYSGSGTGGTWVPVATLTGNTTGQTSAITVPYKYFTVSYAVASGVHSTRTKATAVIYLYRQP